MSDYKTITSCFETVDLAELAAKNIKNGFTQVKAITIKYRNVPHSQEIYRDNNSMTHDGANAFLAATAIGNGMAGMNSTGYPGIFPYAGKMFARSIDEFDNTKPENLKSTESKLIIKAHSTQCQQIEARLRGLGAEQMHVTT